MRILIVSSIVWGLAATAAAAPAPATDPGRTASARAATDAGESEPADRGDPADRTGEREDLAATATVVRGPAVAAVLTAAYAAAGLDRDPQDSWIRRARLSGLVPWVTVRTARDTSWQDEHAEVGHGTSLEVRATWRLDQLVFDAKELQVAALTAARRRERRRLATRVIRAYFTWQRAASAANAAGEADGARGPQGDRVQLRVAETVAELDALTDGWFSRQLSRPRSGAARATSSGKP